MIPLYLTAWVFLSSTSLAQAAPPLFEAVAGGEKPLPNREPTTSRELRLKGSRGETLNFMLKAPLKGCEPIRLAIPRVSARFFRMETINIENPSYPGATLGPHYDPLIPIPQSACPGKGKTTWIWGELEIPASLPPGDLSGEITLGSLGKLPVRLKVWKMKIPERHALPAYLGLHSWYGLLGHYGEWNAGEVQLARKYTKEALRHRMIPLQSLIAPPPVIEGAQPMLDLTRKPSPEQSFKSVVLDQLPKWAHYDLPSVPPEKIASPATPTYFQAVENTLRASEDPGRAFVYLWDEPKPEIFPELVKLLKISKQNAPRLKTMVTTIPTRELEGLVDIFVPVLDFFDDPDHPPSSKYSELQKRGKEIWWYISCMSHGCDALYESGHPDLVIERPAAWVRSIGWMTRKYGLNAFLYYAGMEGYRKFPKRDPWQSLWDFSGNGDGTLFYPGRPGEHGQVDHVPIPSIRLKLWRESSFDVEYVRWMDELSQKPSWWPSELPRLVSSTKKWEKNYSAYQALRDRIGDFLDSKK